LIQRLKSSEQMFQGIIMKHRLQQRSQEEAKLTTDGDDIPKLRRGPVIPLSNITADEMIREISQEDAEFAKLTREKQFERLNSAIREVGGLITKAGRKDYLMDTVSLKALRKGLENENIKGYQNLLKLDDETLKALENIHTISDHYEKVRLQKRSVEIQLRKSEFITWFTENKIPLPQVRESDRQSQIEQFRERIGRMSDSELINEEKLWEDKQRVNPPRTSNIGLTLDYPEVIALRQEKQRRIDARVFLPAISGEDRDKEILKNENRVLTNTVLALRRKLKNRNLTEEELRNVAEQCRNNSGKIIYSKVGKILNIHHTTAKRWLDERGIK
jgi:hypothetical protein